MGDDPVLTRFRQQYGAWLAAARPLLEAGDFKRAFATYPFLRYADAPWTPLRRPLAQSTLALVTTGGLYLQGQQPPFNAAHIEGDTSYRVFSSRVSPATLAIAHTHFPHHFAEQDLNTILPLAHLHRFASDGIIGCVAESVYSITGYLTDVATFAASSARAIAAHMVASGVEAALIVPV
ncbi:MAG: hypothetical protein KatS3mg131_2456 [Candidatus Tectimicrobiota bacterium]|nr:MAG: hypothetical protein KatS3mg131_2456 [Candidatus Tectomicrobia bacterium]